MVGAFVALVAATALAADVTGEIRPTHNNGQTMASAPKALDVAHVTVRHEKGRFVGFTANGGIWTLR